MGGGGSDEQRDQEVKVPPEFQASIEQLFNSAFGAARTAAGQPSSFNPSRSDFFNSQPFSPISAGFGGGQQQQAPRGPTDGRGNPIGLGGGGGGFGGNPFGIPTPGQFGGGGFGGGGLAGGGFPGTGAGFQPQPQQTGPGIGGGASFSSGRGPAPPPAQGGFAPAQPQSQPQPQGIANASAPSAPAATGAFTAGGGGVTSSGGTVGGSGGFAGPAAGVASAPTGAGFLTGLGDRQIATDPNPQTQSGAAPGSIRSFTEGSGGSLSELSGGPAKQAPVGPTREEQLATQQQRLLDSGQTQVMTPELQASIDQQTQQRLAGQQPGTLTASSGETPLQAPQQQGFASQQAPVQAPQQQAQTQAQTQAPPPSTPPFDPVQTPAPTDFLGSRASGPFVTKREGDERDRVPLAFGEPIVGQQFGGPFIAPANQLELESLGAREQVGRDLAGAGNITSQLGQATAAGAFLSPDSNPFLRQTIEAANRPTIENFQRNILPSFNSRAIQGGAFKGSSAREFVQAQLASDLSNTVGDTSARLAGDNFARERQLQQNAPFLIDAGARLNQLSPEILGQVGQGVRGLEQLNIQNELLRQQEQNEAPFRPLFSLASILSGQEIGSSTREKSSGSTGGGAGQAIGGGIAGAGLLGSILAG